MRIAKWMLALMALLACGLIAVGCGDDDEDSGSSDEPATEESSDSSSDDSSSTEGSTPDDVLAACEEVIEGTAAETAGQAGCQAAADAFEQCLTQSEDIDDEAARETALTACQDAADQAVAALESAPGG
jgi:hypothetical protein